MTPQLQLGLDEALPYLKKDQRLIQPIAVGYEEVLKRGGHVLVLVLPKSMVDTTVVVRTSRAQAWYRAASHVWDISRIGDEPKWCLVPRVIAKI